MRPRLVIPVVGNAGVKRLKQGFQAGQVGGLQQFVKTADL